MEPTIEELLIEKAKKVEEQIRAIKASILSLKKGRDECRAEHLAEAKWFAETIAKGEKMLRNLQR